MTFSVVVRSHIGGNPERRSKITNQPLSKLNPDKARQIKEAEGTKHIPVIVLSTHPQIHKVKDVCADEIVEKPFDIDGLLEALEEQLKENS